MECSDKVFSVSWRLCGAFMIPLIELISVKLYNSVPNFQSALMSTTWFWKWCFESVIKLCWLFRKLHRKWCTALCFILYPFHVQKNLYKWDLWPLGLREIYDVLATENMWNNWWKKWIRVKQSRDGNSRILEHVIIRIKKKHLWAQTIYHNA